MSNDFWKAIVDMKQVNEDLIEVMEARSQNELEYIVGYCITHLPDVKDLPDTLQYVLSYGFAKLYIKAYEGKLN